MFPTGPGISARIRRRWRRSQDTAQVLHPFRLYFPTNLIRDAVYTRRGLKWGVPVMLLAAPYIAGMALLTNAIEHGASGGLHLLVLLFAYNALKMLWLGPMSLIRLVHVRNREHSQRRAADRAARADHAPSERELAVVGGVA